MMDKGGEGGEGRETKDVTTPTRTGTSKNKPHQLGSQREGKRGVRKKGRKESPSQETKQCKRQTRKKRSDFVNSTKQVKSTTNPLSLFSCFDEQTQKTAQVSKTKKYEGRSVAPFHSSARLYPWLHNARLSSGGSIFHGSQGSACCWHHIRI